MRATNCLFFDNRSTAGLGGVVFQRVSDNAESSFSAMNSTFVSNQSFGQGNVSMCDWASGSVNAHFTNSIFWNNTSPLAAGRSFFNGGVQAATHLSYCMLQAPSCALNGAGTGMLNCGSGLIHGYNPMFVNLVGGDLHLLANSPARDVATALGAPSVDFEGNPRPQGAGYDLGAYESQAQSAEVQIDGDFDICTGENSQLMATLGTLGSTYLWSTGETTADITVSPLANTTYSVTLTNPFGVTASDTVTITVSSLSVSITHFNVLLCDGGVLRLTASGGTDYVWNNGATGFEISAGAAGTYAVTASLASGCSGSASTVILAAPPILPQAIGTPATCATGCDGTATVTAAEPASFVWDNGTSAASVSGLCVGTHTVVAMDVNGCLDSTTVTIGFVDLPPSIVCLSAQSVIGPGSAVMPDYALSAVVSDDCGAVTVVQAPLAGTSYVFPTTETVVLTATDASGQTSSCSFEVNITIAPPATSACSPGAGFVLFVDDDAAGDGSGTSWANAFTDLQEALAVAAPNTNILVAEGTYYPTDDTLRSATFELLPSVNLYGGYPNGGGAFADPLVYPTILSADIGVPGTASDNSRRLLTAVNVGDQVTICGFVVRDAYSHLDGSGLLVQADSVGLTSSPNFVDCHFVQNQSTQRGGAAYVFALDGGQANPRFDYCRFTGNSAGLSGGALATTSQNGGGVFLQVFFSTFETNSAIQRGGAIANVTNAGGLTLSTTDVCTFEGNSSAIGGGAVWCFSSNGASQTYTANGSNFSGNTSVNGGAVHCSTLGGTLNLNLSGGLFTANSTTGVSGKGGALNCFSDLTAGTIIGSVVQCDFEGNSSPDGGAVYNQASRAGMSILSIAQCRFAQNSGSGRGGAFSQASSQNTSNASTSFTNCLFWNNSASSGTGGAMAQSSTNTGISTVSAVNCTFASNTSFGNGSVSFINAGVGSSASLTVLNSIFRGNTTTLVIGRPFFQATAASTATVSYSLLQAATCALNSGGPSVLSCGAGNLFALDPMFVDIASGDLQLQLGSPAIDAGDFAGAPMDDYLGNLRPAGAGIDLGAYEYGATFRRPDTDPLARNRPLELLLSPNPTTGAFVLTLDRAVTGTIQLFDMQGRSIATRKLNGENQVQLDLSSEAGGIYLVRVVSGEEVATKQVVLHRP
jgi:predicted outer membrane repeat protein